MAGGCARGRRAAPALAAADAAEEEAKQRELAEQAKAAQRTAMLPGSMAEISSDLVASAAKAAAVVTAETEGVATNVVAGAADLAADTAEHTAVVAKRAVGNEGDDVQPYEYELPPVAAPSGAARVLGFGVQSREKQYEVHDDQPR